MENELPEQAKEILTHAAQIELLSLHPNEKADKPAERLLEWKMLGKTTVIEPTVRHQLLTALDKALAAKDVMPARCFIPRHAVRASAGTQTVDLVICFQCKWLFVYYNHHHERAASLTLDDSAEALMDQLLQAAGVPLADKAS